MAGNSPLELDRVALSRVFENMMENTGILEKARTAVAGMPGCQGSFTLMPAEKGVHRGVLALCGGRVLFLKDRFGRIEIDDATELGGLGPPSVRKGFLGWEFRAARAGSEVRFSRLSEEHAAALVEACRQAAGALAAAPPPPGASGHGFTPDASPVPRSSAQGPAARQDLDLAEQYLFGQADFFFGETGDEDVPMAKLAGDTLLEPVSPVVPAPSRTASPASAALVAIREDEAAGPLPDEPDAFEATLVAEPAVEEETVSSGPLHDRRFLIARMHAGGETSPACAEAVRQISELPGSTPSAPEAADFLIAFSASDLSDLAAAGSNFGIRMAVPMLGLADNLKLDPVVRGFAFRALGAFCSTRLLSFLIFHGGHERDPSVLRAVFDAIALNLHESSLRFLVSQVKLRRAPISGLARESLSRTRWVGVAVALSPASEDWDDEDALNAAACARILRLPGVESSGSADMTAAAAAAFRKFRGSTASDDPFKLLRASVEANIGAIQSHDARKSLEGFQNLLDLTDRLDEEVAGSLSAEERDPSGWVTWWAVAKARNPNTWLDSQYIAALGLPVPLSGSPSGLRTTKHVQSGNAGSQVKPIEKAARALLAGVVSGAAYWVLVFGLSRMNGLPFEYRALLPFVIVAAAGPLVWGKAGWALKTAGFGAVGLVPLIFAGLTGFGSYGIVSALYWASLSVGFYRARKSPAGFFPAALAGALIFLGYTALVNMLFNPVTVPSWANAGLMASFFWGVQFIPLTRQQLDRA